MSSFVTLTTMGYGDIMPVHPLARAVLEALTGQLYLTIMLARFVSLELGPGTTADAKAGRRLTAVCGQR